MLELPDINVESNMGRAPSKFEITPNNECWFVYSIYFLLGIGFLLPWNAFITAIDYFDQQYPSYHTDRVFSVFYMLPNLCSLLLLVKLVAQHVLPYTRVMGGFLLFLCALLSVPVAHALEESGHLSKPGSFALICFGCLLNGVADGMVQGSLFGEAAQLPVAVMQELCQAAT
ncbi:hypothetical protein CYMTET_34201 [Cymbomonas tetramitiformis]|uniref:Equilibrative nucleoside transporter 1 n=1 Tax=Cymbomonas tetramitiformis TaxID=36881 RepID=A0AAE0FBL1_9CHLO|nr:hypothetical protein CYMTET_34201 [Cymbomonas tetramitiformis]